MRYRSLSSAVDCTLQIPSFLKPLGDTGRQWDGETKVCSQSPGHVTKMAAMYMQGKNFKIFFVGAECHIMLKPSIQHRVLEYHIVCSNDDPTLK